MSIEVVISLVLVGALLIGGIIMNIKIEKLEKMNKLEEKKNK
ncbi:MULTISPECIES: hypothetical protein [Clostridium]|nr:MULTISPECIES: hypothetical protein [Clostridium]